MKRIDVLKKALEDGSLIGEMTICRAALCCSIRKIEFHTTDPKLNPLKERLQRAFEEIGIPEYLIDDIEMIWWDGHLDGVLRISDDNNFYWYCENDIYTGDLNEGYVEDLLKELISKNKKQKDIWVFECNDGQTYRLTDPFNGNDEERIEEYGTVLGGLELSHVTEIAVCDIDEYSLEYSYQNAKVVERLKQWLCEDVSNID